MRVYIHIPFCIKKCPYCAFGSICEFDLLKAYFNALEKDLKFSIENLQEKISSIFVGGGTPSVVSAKFYEKILEILKPYFMKDCEISFEANPSSTNASWLKTLYKMGVNRISFGAQSFNEKKLKFLGRSHSVNDIFTAVQNAKNAGFDNINVDLIYATKMDNKKLLEFELLNIKKLDINHISAYSLNLEQNTEFFQHKNYQKNMPNLSKFLFKGLENLGFMQYEISNFAKKNYECKHNLGYWRGDDYIGVGAFSVGTLNNIRLYASSNLNDYINNPLFRKKEILTDENIAFERIFLGLRSKLGVHKKFIKNQKMLEILLKNQKLQSVNSYIFNKNFLLADEFAINLL